MTKSRGKALGILLAVVGARCLSSAGHGSNIEADPAAKEIARHVRKGDRALRAGDLDAALAEFSAADAVEIFEAPNYQVLPRIAEVYCRKGEKSRAGELLTSVLCMASIDEGKLPCFVAAAGSPPDSRNPAVTELCFERMCSEAYLGYYEKPTELQISQAEAIKALAIKIEAKCRE
jgi:hypothetical protein